MHAIKIRVYQNFYQYIKNIIDSIAKFCYRYEFEKKTRNEIENNWQNFR